MHHHPTHRMKVRDLGIDTYREHLIYMHADCPITKSEGFTTLTRLSVNKGKKHIVATLNVVHSNLVMPREAGLSKAAMDSLGVREGDSIIITHLKPIESLSLIRSKMYGRELTDEDFTHIIDDVVNGRYSNIELAAFISACSGDHLSVNEIIGLTKAMIHSGKVIHWKRQPIMDKHCVGGLPGNRTTPIVVSIVAAAGLTIPKTSSRSITSPAGTADTMETMTTVNLDIGAIRRVIHDENACLVWGNAVKMSPADDILISVERALDIDSAGQMIASVLSKKVAAGSTHILIDIPIGKTAKVRSHEEALKLQYYFKSVSEAIGVSVEVVFTDGEQPVGRGIGPALEAMDVLSVLRQEPDAPASLRERALQLAGYMLELSGNYGKGTGYEAAASILNSGKALAKFMAICQAQGGFKEPVPGKYQWDITAGRPGTVTGIDNRKLARVAKLAGAPFSKGSGIRFLAPLGRTLQAGEPLFTLYAESKGELWYARNYLTTTGPIITLE